MVAHLRIERSQLFTQVSDEMPLLHTRSQETNVWAEKSLDQQSTPFSPIYVVALVPIMKGCWIWWNLKPPEFCGHVGIPKIETKVALLGLSRDSLGGT